VKDGFIRAASIGVNNAVFGEVGGVPAMLTCDMVECSICDIPGNENALVLYVGDKPVTAKEEIIKLCKLNLNSMDKDLKPVITALGLPENAGIDEIVKSINRAILPNNPQGRIEMAVKDGIIEGYERDGLIKMAASNQSAFNAYLEKRTDKVMQERKKKGIELTATAIRNGAINCDEKGIVKDFWIRNFCRDFEETGIALSSIPEPFPVYRQLQMSHTGTEEDRSRWTLNDYRKKAPMELRNNPGLYKTQKKKEKN
jgi:hypothetical protein